MTVRRTEYPFFSFLRRNTAYKTNTITPGTHPISSDTADYEEGLVTHRVLIVEEDGTGIVARTEPMLAGRKPTLGSPRNTIQNLSKEGDEYSENWGTKIFGGTVYWYSRD